MNPCRGGARLRVNVVDQVTSLVPDETVRLDSSRLDELYVQLGEIGAEDVVCRAVEELAVRLSHCERLWRRQDLEELKKCARSLIAIADQVGMSALARVAGDLTHAIDRGNAVAAAAILTRLIRIGARSLTAVWDLHDLSV